MVERIRTTTAIMNNIIIIIIIIITYKQRTTTTIVNIEVGRTILSCSINAIGSKLENMSRRST